MNNDSISKTGRQVSSQLLHTHDRSLRVKPRAPHESSETDGDAVKSSIIPEVISVSRISRIDSLAVAQALADSLATHIREHKAVAEEAHAVTSDSLKLLS